MIAQLNPGPNSTVTPYVCPPRLTAESRVDFRRDALAKLAEATAAGDRAVVLDLGPVVEIDASGLGVLILLQKRAREQGIRTRLINVSGAVEQLLDATRMGPLFDIVRVG